MKRLFFIFCFVLLFPLNIVHAGPEGYLKKGTFALNPENQRDIFLYIPGKTLLFKIQDEEIQVGSIAFPDQQRTYLNAITQDGINVLVWSNEVKKDIESLSRFDFFVNRRLPLCLTADSCEEIWSKFNRVSDEGDGWLAIWPGAGGKFKEQIGNIQKVRMDAGGWDDGYIPAKRNGLSIEDYGYITNLKRTHPLFSFHEEELQDLNTSCGQQIYSTNRNELFTKIETYGKVSAKHFCRPNFCTAKYHS